jgi:monofunctional biosynthetic peptidoglycan transglycosylase
MGSIWRRVRRWLLGVLLGLVSLSVVLVAALRWVDPPWSAVMLQRLALEGAPQAQSWVDLDRIAPAMRLAVVAAEDQRFPDHHGFDTREILAAVERRLDGGTLRGASTITQQTARNLFLWQERSFVRKGLESWFTVLIELLWPKHRILEMYLNFAETGERMFGVAVAAERYFGTTPAGLSQRQAALVAAALPNPVRYRVASPSRHLLARQAWILEQMDNLGAGHLQRVSPPRPGSG